MEIWKDIVGYEGLYKASTLGCIKSQTRKIRGPYNSTRIIRGRILVPKYCSRRKYLQVGLCKGGKITYKLIHRTVLSTFHPNKDQSLDTNHKDMDTYNNKLSNLEWCTRSQNLIHAFKNGRALTHLTREQCHLTKLKGQRLMAFIALRKLGFKIKDLAIMFDMSISALEKVITKFKLQRNYVKNLDKQRLASRT